MSTGNGIVAQTATVWIHQANRTIRVPATQTILEAALDQGIAYPHGCRSGRCGTCKSRLIEGRVDLLEHTRFALTDTEKAAGLILACRALPREDAVVAWLGDEEEQPDHPVRQLSAWVKSVQDVTHDVRILRLTTHDAPLAFSAGQYVRLIVPGRPSRDYSMANQPGQTELEFHVRRVPGGATSEHIHRNLKPGDAVRIKGPFGSSWLRHGHTGPILAIAGGSGLAPIQSIIATALSMGMAQPIHLYFGVRTARDLYRAHHFQDLANRHLNLHFIPVLSDETGATPFRTGYVSDAVADDIKDLDGWKTYTAGPPPMIDAVMATTATAGLRQEDLHADVFFTPEDDDADVSSRQRRQA
jgi:CDP-4-dehydro-6-deoxyglucose reductase/ferredoxin-NAD(P)+ reductase (naphthalene dioxygenase ferredoxin-specific)